MHLLIITISLTEDRYQHLIAVLSNSSVQINLKVLPQ